MYFGLFIYFSRIYVYLYLKYEYMNDEILNRTRSLYKPQAPSFDLASKCEVIKIYSRLSVLLLINVILGVRERVRLQPHLVASSGGREKIKHLGVKQTKQSVTT